MRCPRTCTWASARRCVHCCQCKCLVTCSWVTGLWLQGGAQKVLWLTVPQKLELETTHKINAVQLLHSKHCCS